jgi:hypothetical protein
MCKRKISKGIDLDGRRSVILSATMTFDQDVHQAAITGLPRVAQSIRNQILGAGITLTPQKKTGSGARSGLTPYRGRTPLSSQTQLRRGRPISFCFCCLLSQLCDGVANRSGPCAAAVYGTGIHTNE